MTALKVYLHLYSECFRKAFAAIAKNPCVSGTHHGLLGLSTIIPPY